MQTVVIGTAGHIDHGKSSLVKALTGTDPDRLKEEQDRGITIDLGFAHFTSGATQVALVDVPGHERFVRNMLAGAGGIDAVVLVIDAAESVRPQTREHFEICRLLGVDRGVIALTKIDLADRETLARSRDDAAALVAGSFLEDAPILEVSARTGEGLEEFRAALVGLAGRPPRQARSGIVRLPVDRAFAMKGFGAVVTGTLVSGTISEGESVLVLPEGRTSRVRGVQVHGKKVPRADAPQRVAVNLADVETRDLRRGQTLATEGTLTVTNRADVRLTLLSESPALRHGARVRVHSGSSELTARVSIAATRTSGADGWTPVQPGDVGVQVDPGASAFVRLRFGGPAVLTRGDRLILRAASPLVTIGGATVLDAEPPVSGVRRETALARFEQLDGPELPIVFLLAERGEAGLGARDLVRRWGLDVPRADSIIDSILREGRGVRVGDKAVDTRIVERWETRVVEMLQSFHRAHPLEAGLAPGAIRDRTGGHAPDALIATVLGRLAERGVTRGSDRVALSSHAPGVSPEQQRLQSRVERAILDGGLAPPDPAEVTTLVGGTVAGVDHAIQWLLREKRLVRAGGLLFHTEALGALKGAVQSQRAGTPAGTRVTLDVGTFKAKFNLTRKHAIPLLEWLDRERVTRRAGDVRIVL